MIQAPRIFLFLLVAIVAGCGGTASEESGAGGTSGTGAAPGSGGHTASGEGSGGQAGNTDTTPPSDCRCADGENCDWNCGETTGTCADTPEICPSIYAPVCGCDGRTYGNDCERLMAQMGKAHEGECAAAACDCKEGEHCQFTGSCGEDVGVCIALTECADRYDPVCGCDGVTYDSHCFLVLADVAMDHEGACE